DRNIADEVEQPCFADGREHLAADLIEYADPCRGLLRARLRRMRAVQLEHRQYGTLRADDLGGGTRRHQFAAQIEQQRRGSAVEMLDSGEIELHVRRRRTGEPPDVLPPGEALTKAQFTGEAPRSPAALEIHPVDVIAGPVSTSHGGEVAGCRPPRQCSSRSKSPVTRLYS